MAIKDRIKQIKGHSVAGEYAGEDVTVTITSSDEEGKVLVDFCKNQVRIDKEELVRAIRDVDQGELSLGFEDASVGVGGG